MQNETKTVKQSYCATLYGRGRPRAEHPSSRENLDVTSVRSYVRTNVRPYARIRAGDEFVFVLDLESISDKK